MHDSCLIKTTCLNTTTDGLFSFPLVPIAQLGRFKLPGLAVMKVVLCVVHVQCAHNTHTHTQTIIPALEDAQRSSLYEYHQSITVNGNKASLITRAPLRI